MAVSIQPLRPYMLFTDKNGNLTKDAYDFLFSMFQRIGGSVDSINASTLETHTWEKPGQIGALTPSSGVFTTLDITNGVTENGNGFKHGLFPTSSVPANTEITTTCFWTDPFPDDQYTVVCSVQSTHLIVSNISFYTADQVSVTVKNTSTTTADTGTIHIIAVHS